MLRLHLITVSLVALLMACTPARAATLEMQWPGETDPWQVVPLPAGGVKTVDKNGLRIGSVTIRTLQPSAIAMPDGSWWSTGTGPSQPIAYIPPTLDSATYLPALPSGAQPTHWTVGPDGKLWFTEGIPISNWTFPDLLGRLDPVTRTVTEFGGLSAGAVAQSITTGRDGNLWFLEFGTNSVGRMTPAGSVTEFPLPSGMHLVQQRGQELTVGPDGDLYFIVSGGIAHMSTAGALRPGIINGGIAGFAPNALAYGRDGNLWATECAVDGSLDSATRISPSGTVTRSPEGTFPGKACPIGMTAGPDGTPWLYEWNTGRAGRVVFDTPLAITDDPTAIGPTAADLNGEVTPRGVTTTVHFEYGATTAYGRATPDQTIGDGDGTTPVTARPGGLQPAATYHYRLVAKSVIGTVVGADQTVTTTPVPPVPPPPLPADDDHDGYAVTVDCDDLSAAIHPGALDKPGDRIDQDCSGADAPYQRFQPHADAGWKTIRGRIVFTHLTIDGMPAGSSLKLTCSGPGCKLRGYTATIAKPVRRLDVSKRLKQARLRAGATVELTLRRPGYITTIMRWTIGPPPRVTILCQPPAAKKPAAC